ncbi:ribonuclease III [Prochlorococcus marinus XMU1403]|uniref:Mini-ribonuclease 3 n=1 Tax=Prochlorococcus marinus TaxID=1219 RepID=UPI000D917C4A|nr:ribonuclease III domain-containing protein [Prochlorococcus marinus]MBW3049293.1 ribonuclease III [Prochlorococcus marinus str. MU1403]PYE02248.1 ribonuclease III [Prochlorococcus marinus XMU1403]
MTDWIRSYKSTISPDGLGPLQLAWLGDAVWEMHQRLRYCSTPMRSKDLHNAVVKEVNASSQAMAITKLEPFLTDTEKSFLRKGRNKAGRGPKNVDAATYAIATGFETIVGWLFLKNPNRLADLFDLLDRPIN